MKNIIFFLVTLLFIPTAFADVDDATQCEIKCGQTQSECNKSVWQCRKDFNSCAKKCDKLLDD